MQRFRGGLVFKAHGLCVSLNSRLESCKEEKKRRWYLVSSQPPVAGLAKMYIRCPANMAHIRQSSPDYGLDFQAKVLKVYPLRWEAVGE